MNKIKIFENSELGFLKVVEHKNEVWFVSKNIADLLGYQNGSRDINRHVDIEDRTKAMISDGKQLKNTILINESGLYSLIFSSKLDTAKKFKRWVTSEVLPQIRKNGQYKNKPAKTLTQLEMLKIAVEEIETQNKLIEEMKPKSDFYDVVAAANGTIDFLKFSKLLNKNNEYLKLGRNNLFKLLRTKNILNKDNMPLQRYIQGRFFKVIEKNYEKDIYLQTQITPKGQQYLVKKIKEWGYLD